MLAPALAKRWSLSLRLCRLRELASLQASEDTAICTFAVPLGATVLPNNESLGLSATWRLSGFRTIDGMMSHSAHLLLAEMLQPGDLQRLQCDIRFQLPLDIETALDMSLISRFTRLVNLHLDGYVEGFAANNLTPLCRLEDLRMRGTSVVGDLAFVKNLNTLRDLELTGSVFMGGNLQALEHNANLETLMLSKVDMNIDDNVKSLRSLVRLQRLDLSYTCVIGSLSFARNLTLLNALSLESTNVEGNMSTLQRLVLLTHLDLDYTQVHMCERVRACLRGCV